MKTNRLFISAAIILIFAACTKSVTPVQEGGDSGDKDIFSIEVSLPSSEELKTYLGEYGATTANVYDILWKTGDKVKANGVLSQGVDAKYNGQKRANFSFSSALAAPYYVIYPGDKASGDVVAVPATQTYTEGSFDPAAAPMYASSTSQIENLQMQNLTGTLCFMMKGTDKISRIEINTIGGEGLAGNVTLSKDKNLYTGAFTIVNPVNVITLSCGDGLQLTSTATPIYIPVLAQTYTQGFIAKIYNAAGNYMQLKFWSDAAFTVSGTALYKFETKEFLAGREDILILLSDMDVEENNFETHITVGCTNLWSSGMRQKYYNDRNNSSGDYYFTGDGRFVDNDPRLWDTAKEHLGTALTACNYDVFGACEINNSSMLNDIKAQIPSKYTWHAFNLNGSDGDDGYEAIVYNTDVFEETGSGQKWLTENGNKRKYPSGHITWEEGNYRMIIWSFLRHKVTGQTIMFCHCHAPLNDDYNTWCGSYVKSFVSDANTNSYPVIFVGDLNSCPNHTVNGNGGLYDELLGYWKHAYVEAVATNVISSKEKGYPCTYESQRGQQSMLQDESLKHQLDHVFYSSEFIITNYWTQRYRYKMAYSPADSGYRNFYPSDHVPVVVELSL